MQGKDLPDSHAHARIYVGIDICKAYLDIYLHPLEQSLRVQNNTTGLRQLKRKLAGLDVALVVMEATSKYHRQAHRTLDAAALPVAIINPLRARLFAECSGILAKTDAVDARLLAVLGQALQPAAQAPPSQALEELSELVRTRRQAVASGTALSNQLGAAHSAFLKRELARQIKNQQAFVARLHKQIIQRIAAEPALKRRYDILTSIPGIGPIVAIVLTIDMSELGACSTKAAAMLAGLAPIACDSGDTRGQRRIRGGRAHVRSALYMAAVAATRANPDLRAFYKRLIGLGKKPKLALTAVMRKLIVLANTLLTQDRPWQPVSP